MQWNLSDAKNRLSEVLDKARTAPQRIKRRSESFVILPEDRFNELSGKTPSFIEYLVKGPRVDGFEPMPRADAPMRDPQL
jgi:prevent-host-death family protein